MSDFTTDATWNDLDCSAKVPAGARFIIFRVQVYDGSINQVFCMRKNGNSNAFNVACVRTQVANQYNDATFIIPCDKNRVVEYMGSNTTFSYIYVTILGWII